MKSETEKLVKRMFAATEVQPLEDILREANAYARAKSTPLEDADYVSQATELVAMRLEAAQITQ